MPSWPATLSLVIVYWPALAYFIICRKVWRKTLGMRLLGIGPRSADPVPPVDTKDSTMQAVNEPAGMGRRLIAFLIDVAILWATYFVFLAVVFVVFFLIYSFGFDSLGDSLLNSLESWENFENRISENWFLRKLYQAGLVGMLYFIPCWALWGATIGKRIMGLRVERLSVGMNRWISASIRLFAMFFLAPLWITWWPCIFRKDRRGIHDLLAGTMVISSKPEPTEP